jgi:hypothetical protein
VRTNYYQNWFQNRRAKAKQQKKQEEFENAHLPGGGPRQEPESGENTNESKEDDDQSEDDEDFPSRQTVISEPDDTAKDWSNDVSREAGWASLQRALNAAKVAQSTQQAPSRADMTISMPPPRPQDETNVSSSDLGLSRGGITQTSHSQDFPRNHSWADAWASHHVFQDQSFDFGFESQAALADCSQPGVDSVPTQKHLGLQENCLVSSDSWQDGLPTPRGGPHHPLDIGHDFQSPDLPFPAYHSSRRGSAADSLTNNLDAFALTNDSPHALTTPVPAVPFSQPEAQLDLAARRKGRRPAPLTSTALRSRSYGAMTSMSPTFRPGMSPSAHTIRHVKSTGHNLNARYSGIRKPSSAQRSPNISTFGEAEAFNRLMAQQAAIAQATMKPTTENAGPLLSPPLMVNVQNPLDHIGNPMAYNFELARTYQLPITQHLTLTTTSPPTTPFAAEFDKSQAAFGMPPVSAPLQYASFSDCTPPYSAGPLTNSSWSDAPLTSPDLPNFPPVTYIPSLGHMQKHDSMSGHFQDFVLASDTKPGIGPEEGGFFHSRISQPEGRARQHIAPACAKQTQELCLCQHGTERL